jgi:hypothetical protein
LKGGLDNLAREIYPNYPWDFEKWKINSGSKMQLYLYKMVASLLPEDIQIEHDIQLHFLKYTDTDK